MQNKTEKFDENSYCMLLKKSKDKLLCDFCDETFDSRYLNIVHNTHHIVIPLLKQVLHQCIECLHYFQTVNELDKHLLEKHNNIVPLQATGPSTKDNIDVSDDKATTTDKEGTRHSKDLAMVKIQNGCVVEKRDGVYSWNVAINKKVTGYNFDPMKDIKNEEYILPDVYYDVKILPNTNSLLQNTQSVSTNNPDVMVQNGSIKEIERSPSVHYNVLTQPFNYKCKRCDNHNIFPNRYALTLHQTSHLEITNTQPNLCLTCDKYFSVNDLKTHQLEKHWNIAPMNCKLNTCVICNFKYYNYKKHLFNYHYNAFGWEGCPHTTGDRCGNVTFKSVCEFSVHSDTDVVVLCVTCYTKEINSNTECRIISRCKKRGCVLKCSGCETEVTEVTFVEKKKRVFVSKLMFEGDVGLGKVDGRCKKKTNERRLRNIQMRLRMINKLSRFYVCVF